MVNDYTTFVYKDEDGYYVAKDTYGQILAENNNAPETIIKTGLDRKGILKIRGGPFDCSSGLTAQGGLKLKRDTLINCGPDTTIRVPNGYAGNLWVADYTYDTATLSNTGFIGTMNVDEQGTPQRLWNGIGLVLKDPGSPASRGITMCDLGNMFVYNAKSALVFDLQHIGGWVTSCNFKNLKIFYCINGIEFINTVGITSVPPISSNNFEYVWYQSGGQTEYGVKDVMGKNLWFKDVAIWDLQVSTGGTGGGRSATFTPYCDNIYIEGGIMMYYNVINNAPKAKVRWIDAHSTTSVWQYYEELTPYAQPGDGIKRVFTIPHGMGFAPDWFDVIPYSDDALVSPIRWAHDATNIVIYYQGKPPPPATAGNLNNVVFKWRSSIK